MATPMTPKIAQPSTRPSRAPSTPPKRAPKVTNGIVPNVARPQLNSIASKGKPRLLKAVLATNRQVTNTQAEAPERQNNTTKSALSPCASNKAASQGAATARIAQAASA